MDATPTANFTAPLHRLLSPPGGRIHAVEQGDGPLVLLVHGLPEGRYSWRHQLPVIAAAGYRAVAINVRGYGRSSKRGRSTPIACSPTSPTSWRRWTRSAPAAPP